MDLVIRGAHLVNVFTAEIYKADIGIKEDRFAAVARYENEVPSFVMEGVKEIDAKGMYAMPGFIDSHVHIESTMVTPDMFAREVLRHGTTTAVIDPHEMANVMGAEGVKYMVEASQGLPVQILTTIPSCVPAVPGMETAGAAFQAEDIAALLELPGVIGIAELMDFPGVINQNERMAEIVQIGLDKQVFNEGHAPRVSGRDLQAYLASGVNSDHESRGYEEVLEKLRSGMTVYIRESSASQFADVVAKAWKEIPHAANIAMCTDDVEPSDMFRNGQMDRVVRRSIEEGIPAALAIRYASLGGAMRFGLRDQGAIAPGYIASFLLVDSLEKMDVKDVYVKGEHAVADGGLLAEINSPVPPLRRNTVKLPLLSEEDFVIKTPVDNGKVTVTTMEFTDLGTTIRGTVELDAKNGIIATLPAEYAFVTVVGRHGQNKKPFVGVIKNTGIKHGAYATTLAHDSHNVVMIGKNAADMLKAVRELEESGGGLCLVNDGEVLAHVALPIAGLMSPEPVEELAPKVEFFSRKVSEMGVSVGRRSPAMALSALALTVIPEIRISDLGLVDVAEQKLIPLFE
jgi:adenine deaminase